MVLGITLWTTYRAELECGRRIVADRAPANNNNANAKGIRIRMSELRL